MRQIFNLNTGVFLDVWDAISEHCEHNVALMKDAVVFEIVQERDWCAFGLPR